MAESSTHMMFVNRLVEETEKIVPSNNKSLIYSDKPTSLSKPPRTNENFVPDLYYCFKDLLIIGEAKTADDVEREHSLSQYESYVEAAISFKGKSILIFASPWFTKNTMKNNIRKIFKKYNSHIECRFLTELGEAEII